MAMSVLLLFLDGVGCGERLPGNPATATAEQLFASFDQGAVRDKPLPKAGVALRLDANMGVKGRPQSGTGHTAILTGRNAPQMLGMHLWALPNDRLREALRSDGIFGSLNRAGFSTRFLNAYRPPFFDWGDALWTNRKWRRYLSATSWANHYAGNPFFDIDDLRARRSVSHDFSNKGFAEAGFDVPVLSMEEAGAIVARAASRYDFSMHEHFLTDLVGHRGDYDDALRLLSGAETFLLSVLEHLDLERHSVLVCSDHGNIEEPWHGRHTENAAVGMVFGPLSQACDRLQALYDIAPVVQDHLKRLK